MTTSGRLNTTTTTTVEQASKQASIVLENKLYNISKIALSIHFSISTTQCAGHHG